MASDNQIKITNLPKASEVKSGDYIILETDTGTSILDYKDFIIGSDNITFWARLSGNTTNIKSLSTTNTSLSAELASFRTVVSDVSGLSGIVWKDTWDSSTTYKVSQAVQYNNSSYIALIENTNQQPVDSSGNLNSNWNYLAKAGIGDLTSKGGLLQGVGDGTTVQLDPGSNGYVLKSQGTGNYVTWAQQDTGRPGCVVDDMSYFNRTGAQTHFVMHFLMTNGTVRAAGEGYNTGAGYQQTYNNAPMKPVAVNLPDEYNYQSASDKIRKIVNGQRSTFLITVGGDVYSAGYNIDGQLGLGDTTDRYTFEKITFPDTGVKIRDVVASEDNQVANSVTYFLVENDGTTNNDGRAYASGDNGGGECGDGTTTKRTSPVRVGTLTDIDKLWAWGTGSNGAGSTQNTAFALLTNGKFYGWGYNYQYVLGNGTNTNLSTPTHQTASISFTPGDATSTGLHGVKDVVVNGGGNSSNYHWGSCTVLLTSGHVYFTGENANYGAGNGSTTDLQQWTLVSGVSAVQSIAVHPAYTTSSTLAVCSAIEGGEWNQTTHKYENFTDMTSTSGQLVVGWGYNTYGQLGDGTTTTIQRATRISNNYWPSALAASVSSIHTAAHHFSNNAYWTYIRDLSGYYWFCGRAGGSGSGHGGQWDGHMTSSDATTNRTTPVKMMLPCDPSEIKRFLPVSQDSSTSNQRGVTYILTHDGRVFISGSYVSIAGVGGFQGGTDPQQSNQWIQYSF